MQDSKVPKSLKATLKHKKQRTNKGPKPALSDVKAQALKQKNEAKLKNATEALKNYKPIEVPKHLQAGSIMSVESNNDQNQNLDQAALEKKAQKKLQKKLKKMEAKKAKVDNGNSAVSHAQNGKNKPQQQRENSPKKYQNNDSSHQSGEKNVFKNNNFKKSDGKNFQNNKPKNFSNNDQQQSQQTGPSSNHENNRRDKFADKKRKLSPAYYEAAQLLGKLAQRKGSLNSLISECKNQNMIKLIYRLVIKVLQNQTLIRKICSHFELGTLNKHLVEILICDFLLGTPMFTKFRKVPEIDFILGNEEDIRKHYNEFKDKVGKTYASQPVRYFRINQIISNVDRVVQSLKDEVKLTQKTFQKKTTTFDEFKKMALALKENEFMLDYHFNDIFLVLDQTTSSLKNTELYKNNSISIQDKSSLLAVEAMRLEPQMRILDACAAPGMKSIAIASRLKNNCELFSNDMDSTRYKDMRRFLNNSGVKCAKLSHSDFTALNPEDYTDLDVILLDPSCTGSGMNRRIDYVNENEDKAAKEQSEKNRSVKLSGFQYKLLEKALTFKPKRLVYSTCSKYQTENEDVVEKIFLNYPDLEYDIVDALPGWPLRGTGNAEWAKLCVRSDLDNTLTGGFFCAVFQRKDGVDPNVSAVLEASMNASINNETDKTENQLETEENQDDVDASMEPEDEFHDAEEGDEEEDDEEDDEEFSEDEEPVKRPSNSSVKGSPVVPKTPGNTPVKTPAKSPAKMQAKSPTNTPGKTPTNTPVKVSTKSPAITPAKTPAKTPTNTPVKATPAKATPAKSPANSSATTPVSAKKFNQKRKSEINIEQEEELPAKRANVSPVRKVENEKKKDTQTTETTSAENKQDEQVVEVSFSKAAKGRGAKTPAKKQVKVEDSMKTPERSFTKFSPKMTRSRAKTLPKKSEDEKETPAKPKGKAATKSLKTQLDSVAETPTRSLRKRARN